MCDGKSRPHIHIEILKAVVAGREGRGLTPPAPPNHHMSHITESSIHIRIHAPRTHQTGLGTDLLLTPTRPFQKYTFHASGGLNTFVVTDQ